MKIKRPKQIRWCHPGKGYVAAHRVKTGDNWWNLASKYNFADPWDIIQFNYGTKDPEEVNWYLKELVGCTKSNDGLNYSFDSSDKFGMVFIPPAGWKPTHAWQCAHPYETIRSGSFVASAFQGVPYIQGSTLNSILSNHIFMVGDRNAQAPVEYNYDNIMVVSMPKDASRGGIANEAWFIKEVIHLAYGKHGMNMPYSARTEAVAVIGAFVFFEMFKSYNKLPPRKEFFSWANSDKAQAEITAFVAAYNRNRATANFDSIASLVQREPQLMRRLAGKWPQRQAA
jgi:hypothetical protein